MESAAANQMVSKVETDKGSNVASGWQILWFFYHLAVVYLVAQFCPAWLAGFTRGKLLPHLQIASTSSSQFEFFFSHLFVFSVVPGFLAGLLNGISKHKVAAFVWVVPSAILAYKLLTFSAATSVLQGESSSAFHQYFGGGFLIPEYRDWQDFWRIASSNPDVLRGMAQSTFTAPFYTAVAYSVAVLISVRTDLHRRVKEKVKEWEQERFGNTQ
jgi:hypothetical protein